MMISPETYYDEHIKGKSQSEIMDEINSLKQEISSLKKAVNKQKYVQDDMIATPDDKTRLWCYKQYLKRAELALAEAGGQQNGSACT